MMSQQSNTNTHLNVNAATNAAMDSTINADLKADTNDRLLTRASTENIFQKIEKLMSPGGPALVIVSSYWNGELRWARNRASMTSDRRDLQVFVFRQIRGGKGTAMTNQIDDESLKGVVQCAEWQALRNSDQRPTDMPLEPHVLTAMKTTTWSDASFARTADKNGSLVQRITDAAEQKDLFSAGYLESRGASFGYLQLDQHGRKEPPPYYCQMTQAQCSVTARHPKGSGSGWAGLSGYDINKISEEDIAKRALDKCIASLDPVRVEPGRYTTILEPQAVAGLVDLLMKSAMTRWLSEGPDARKPFYFNYDQTVLRHRSKLGQKVVDERITISQDPADPELGILPVPGARPITWIKNGVLQTLNYDRNYALRHLNENEPAEDRSAYRMSGGTTSIDEMIQTTKRGLLVTRFSSLMLLDNSSLLSTGVTRDGLWLIENGKISKAVRNFRITESPLFVLNNIEQLGVPVPVFHTFASPEYAIFALAHALMPAIVPPMKVRDFSFTSTIDAI